MTRKVFTVDGICYDSAMRGCSRQEMIALKDDGECEGIHWETKHDVWYWRSQMAVDEQYWIDRGYITREGDGRSDYYRIHTQVHPVEVHYDGPWR